MRIRDFSARAVAIVVAWAAFAVAPAALAADVVDVGFIDQGQIGGLPAFVQANRQLADFGADLQRRYMARARGASQGEQQRLAAEFQSKMADRQRQVLGPLLGKAQVAIASIASSKNLSVVIDKRIVVFGGVDITNQVRDLLTGVGDPVPPVSTPPPSSVGYVDQAQIDAVPKLKSASDDFAKFKADQDRTTAEKLKGAKNDADRNAILKDYQKVLGDRQAQTLKPLSDKTRDAIAQVAKKRGLILVVDRGDVVYGGTDITSDVTSALK
jgi:outer membrane protein